MRPTGDAGGRSEPVNLPSRAVLRHPPPLECPTWISPPRPSGRRSNRTSATWVTGTCASSSLATPSGPPASLPARRSGARLLQAPRHRRDDAAPVGRGPNRRGGGPPRRHVRRRSHQHHRGPGRPPSRCACPKGNGSGGRPGCRRRRARRAGPNGGSLRPHPLRHLGRCHRGAHPGRRQHRHRRLGPGTGHGHRGPGRLRLARSDQPVRLQCRPGRPVRGDP